MGWSPLVNVKDGGTCARGGGYYIALLVKTGLASSTHRSGGGTHHGRIIKEGSRWLRWAMVEGFNGWLKSRLTYEAHLAGLRNASIHVSLVLIVAYTVCITSYGIGRPELRQSVAFLA